MKKLITAVIFFVGLLTSKLKAQDVLILANGTELQAKVIEIGENYISYKKYENLNGPTYNSPIKEVFMVIYKNGKREIFDVKDQSKVNPSTDVKDDKNIITSIAALNNSDFEVKLIKAETVPDKKNKVTTVKAEIDVYRDGAYFTNLAITAAQVNNKELNYSKVNGGYYLSSSIYIESKEYAGLFYQKYESYGGKGHGWALPPKFFNPSVSGCSVAFLTQNGFNREQNFNGGLTATKFDLQDCSTIESKLLSIALVWLDVNFVKK